MQYKKKFQSFIEIKITSTAFSMLIDLIQFSKELFYLKKKLNFDLQYQTVKNNLMLLMAFNRHHRGDWCPS